MDRDWFILLFLAFGLLAVSIVEGNQAFSNATVTLALWIIGFILIACIIAFFQWKMRKK